MPILFSVSLSLSLSVSLFNYIQVNPRVKQSIGLSVKMRRMYALLSHQVSACSFNCRSISSSSLSMLSSSARARMASANLSTGSWENGERWWESCEVKNPPCTHSSKISKHVIYIIYIWYLMLLSSWLTLFTTQKCSSQQQKHFQSQLLWLRRRRAFHRPRRRRPRRRWPRRPRRRGRGLGRCGAARAEPRQLRGQRRVVEVRLNSVEDQVSQGGHGTGDGLSMTIVTLVNMTTGLPQVLNQLMLNLAEIHKDCLKM